MKHNRFSPDLPPVWLVLFLGATWALARFVPILRFDLGPLGSLLIFMGLLAIGWSAWWFWRKRTPIEPRETPMALIVEGPYMFNRNPIYSGLVLILAGFAIGCCALSALLPLAFFPWLLTRRFVLPEEAALRAAFGEQADAYISSTRRWLF